MKCLGLLPAFDGGYEQPFERQRQARHRQPRRLHPGHRRQVGGDIIVIGAHHDHPGAKHLGANDNASGVIALLAIAQAMTQRATRPGARSRSSRSARRSRAWRLDTTSSDTPEALPDGQVVQYDQPRHGGQLQSKGWVAAMGTFAKFPARAALDTLKKSYAKLSVGVGGRAARSDHLGFCKAGIPYVFFWTPDKRCYHGRATRPT